MAGARDRGVEVARVLVVLVGAATAALFAFVVYSRFQYPIDAEWMVGAVREGVERVARGEPLYVPPSDGFIPFVYPPLYYWVSALFARFMPALVACKLVSVASTAILGWCIWRVARTLGATRYWSLVGVLLHVGAFSATLMFYDLERVDTFAAAVVALGLVALVTGEDRGRTLVAGVLLGLAFYAKQPHVLSLAASCAALFVAGQRRRAVTVAGIGAVVLASVFAYLEVTTHGWFRFYCVTIPGTHGLEPKVITAFFITDWPRTYMLIAASLAMGIPLVVSLVRTRKVPEGWSWQEVLVAAVVLGTVVEAFSLRAHRGGWTNVIIAWTPFGCMAAAVVASRLEARAAGTELGRAIVYVLLAGAGFELLGGIFDPNDAAPDRDDWGERQRLIAFTRELEKEGDVINTIAAGTTAKSHYQMAAMHDVLRAGRPLPEEYAEGLRTRKYAAILVGEPHEMNCDVKTCDDAFVIFATNYFVGARRADREHTGMTGFDARPRWVMRPRKHPLLGMAKKDLEKRLYVEMGLAYAAMMELPIHTEPTVDDTIEARAAR